MPNFTLTAEEENRVHDIIEHFSPTTHPVMARLKDQVGETDWPETLRFIRAAIRLHIGSRLLPEAFIAYADSVGMKQEHERMEQFKKETELRVWLLHSPLTLDFIDRFEIPTWTVEEKNRIDAYLRENHLTPYQSDVAAAALGLKLDGGTNAFFDTLDEIESEAGEMFFGDMESEIQGLLKANG